jgi:hypothetical protein
MPITVHNAGAALIKIQPYNGSLQELGYTRNGADITTQGFFADVPGDQNGGDQGPPIDIQNFGEIAHIRLELTKWDQTVYNLLKARMVGATAGTPPTSGNFMFQGNLYHRLVVAAVNLPRNFPCVAFREPFTKNFGTRFAVAIVEAIAYKHPETGILYNEVIT